MVSAKSICQSEFLEFSFIEKMAVELKYLPKDHGYRYEMSNCLFEATFEHILEVSKKYIYFMKIGIFKFLLKGYKITM